MFPLNGSVFLSVKTESMCCCAGLILRLLLISLQSAIKEIREAFWLCVGLGEVSHAQCDVIVYFGVLESTRRQNELDKTTSTVLAASLFPFGLLLLSLTSFTPPLHLVRSLCRLSYVFLFFHST